MNPITSFNIKADLKNHPLIYGSVALLALAAIAMSVAQPYISALRSINRYIFLGIGGGLMGSALLGLRRRNCDGHYHFTEEQSVNVGKAMISGQKLLYIFEGEKTTIVHRENGQIEFPKNAQDSANFTMIPPHIVRHVLQFDYQTHSKHRYSGEEYVATLYQFIRPGECLKFSTKDKADIRMYKNEQGQVSAAKTEEEEESTNKVAVYMLEARKSNQTWMQNPLMMNR